MNSTNDRPSGGLLRLALKLPCARSALRYLLSRGGHHMLKVLVLEIDPAGFGAVVRARAAAPLVDALLADDGALLRNLCRGQDADALLPILASILVKRSDALELLTRVPGFQDTVVASPRLHAMVALIQQWERLRPILREEDSSVAARLQEARGCIKKSDQVSDIVLDLIAEGDTVQLRHGRMRFPCRHSLWTLLHEILLDEDYYFESDSDTPHMIDGGAHMGMAIYYFKARFPNARITAFEPHPDLHSLATENVARNGWEGVEVLPLALAATRREATFHISESWSMAGSLSERRARLGDLMREVPVQCVPLGDYLRTPVDFLKLDIEGAEDEVLEEAAPWLHNVANIFCEYHQGAGLSSGRLTRVLAVLEEAGFDVQVGKSHNYRERSRRRPLTHFDGAASMVIWARRRRD
jgi:FkbM family methyltransferase